MNTIKKITLGTIGTIGLAALLYATGGTPDDMIRYSGQDKNGNSTVSVINGDLITKLKFDRKGEPIGKPEMRKVLGISYELGQSKLAELVDQTDFPAGVELAGMLETAREYQRTHSYSQMLDDYLRR